MSSITMAADSTQSESVRRHKHKVKLAQQSNKDSRKQTKTAGKPNSKQVKALKRSQPCDFESDDSDRDSDLDLSKELKPIVGYVGSSEQLVAHMFRSISTKKLKAMLPEILKSTPLDELKSLCVEQLEGMSQKRISRILDGDDAENISSSGSEDEDKIDDNVGLHSSDVEFKGDSEQTSVDPTNRCIADTTHCDSISAAESTGVAESGVTALSTSVESAGVGDDHLSQSAAGASATATQSDVLVDAPSDDTTRSVTYDVTEAADYTNLNEESEVERRLTEMPGTPESLPSLASEPEDTCTPVKFLKIHDDNDNDRPTEASVGSERATGTEAEVEQSSPRAVHCDSDALASAENENNLNVESENSNADRSAELADTAPENAADATDLQVEDSLDNTACPTVTDSETHAVEESDVVEMSAGPATDIDDAELRGHAVLTSCSEMIIDIQDHEFSDEELEGEPPVQPSASQSDVEQHHSDREFTDNKPITIEEPDQPAVRIIRLNRNFPQHLTLTVDVAESQDTVSSGRELSQKPADVPSDVTPETTKATVVSRSNNARTSRPKVHDSSKLPQASRKVVVHAKSADKSKNLARSGEASALKVKSKPSQDSVAISGSKSAVEHKTIKRPQQVVETKQSGVIAETGGSSGSDALSKMQLEILELEMRARAIKAMIRAQEEMEQLESVEKRRRSSGVTVDEQTPRPVDSSTPLGSSVRHPSSKPLQCRGELRSLQSVVGRNIIKPTEFAARRQRRVAGEERFRQQKHLMQQRRLSQSAAMASRRTVRLQPDTSMRPIRHVVSSQSSPRVVRLRSARFGPAPLPLSRRQRQRRLEVHSSLVSPGDKRRVLVSSSQRSVKMSSSNRPL